MLNKQPLLVPQLLELSPTDELTLRCAWFGAMLCAGWPLLLWVPPVQLPALLLHVPQGQLGRLSRQWLRFRG